jgi:hypothetical protein
MLFVLYGYSILRENEMPERKQLEFSISNGCYEVTSHAVNTDGYSRIWMYGKDGFWHRYIWEECFGFVPEGMEVLHKCDNPCCINPEHLFLGTQLDNMRDKIAKNRQAKDTRQYNPASGIRQGSAKLTDEIALRIKARYIPNDIKNGASAMSRDYGVCRATIFHVLMGRTWRHVA